MVFEECSILYYIYYDLTHTAVGLQWYLKNAAYYTIYYDLTHKAVGLQWYLKNAAYYIIFIMI